MEGLVSLLATIVIKKCPVPSEARPSLVLRSSTTCIEHIDNWAGRNRFCLTFYRRQKQYFSLMQGFCTTTDVCAEFCAIHAKLRMGGGGLVLA